MSDAGSSDRIDEVHEEHEKLRATLEAFDLQLAELADVVVVGANEAGGAAIVSAIDQLTRRLGEHFEQEESRGYLTDIYELAPRYSAQADELLAEHADILSHVNDLATRARAGTSGGAVWASLLTAFREFADDLRDHEQAESSLLHRALMEDIGN